MSLVPIVRALERQVLGYDVASHVGQYEKIGARISNPFSAVFLRMGFELALERLGEADGLTRQMAGYALQMTERAVKSGQFPPEFRDELFSLFIDIRHTLKARFPKWLFKAMAEEMYDIYLKQQPEAVPKDKKLF